MPENKNAKDDFSWSDFGALDSFSDIDHALEAADLPEIASRQILDLRNSLVEKANEIERRENQLGKLIAQFEKEKISIELKRQSHLKRQRVEQRLDAIVHGRVRRDESDRDFIAELYHQPHDVNELRIATKTARPSLKPSESDWDLESLVDELKSIDAGMRESVQSLGETDANRDTSNRNQDPNFSQNADVRGEFPATNPIASNRDGVAEPTSNTTLDYYMSDDAPMQLGPPLDPMGSSKRTPGDEIKAALNAFDLRSKPKTTQDQSGDQVQHDAIQHDAILDDAILDGVSKNRSLERPIEEQIDSHSIPLNRIQETVDKIRDRSEVISVVFRELDQIVHDLSRQQKLLSQVNGGKNPQITSEFQSVNSQINRRFFRITQKIKLADTV